MPLFRQNTYQGKSFLNGFDCFTAADPTHGFVEYLDQSAATKKDMLKMIGNDNYIGVYHKTSLAVSNGVGRSSARIESKQLYTQGLFVVDLKHMPAGARGTWSAFWSLSSGTWPTNGEIDIIDGVSQNTANKMVLHTDTDCKVEGKDQTGAQTLYDCALDSASGASGCDVNVVETNTYGTSFNNNDDGVYALEWIEDFIKTWFVPRGRIPTSITADKPDTSTFGTPNANFQGACVIDKKFIDHRFIFDATFCGDWAGNVYDQSGCPAHASLSSYDSCRKLVAGNPSAFEDTSWQISYFKTYKKRQTP
ncbi:glycoside hydrolase family 16 protein [Lophiostoma macrostomum CBS 122681]|uniref:Glycoside hydrolase family 16 protein n=1 Tax=Lophiostoma macrostomum CBS 122681 TaxID=1314788 RepID=A0A6A6SJ03_9PLEO|nr:glycoside hydrolase family 16 protein [Lophiostoma macrostomum CBS 122681]